MTSSSVKVQLNIKIDGKFIHFLHTFSIKVTSRKTRCAILMRSVTSSSVQALVQSNVK